MAEQMNVGRYAVNYVITQEGQMYRVDAEVEINHQIYNGNWYFPESPDSDTLFGYFKQWIAGIEKELAYEANPLNQDFSAELGDELKNIIIEAVRYVRNYPDVDVQGFKEWYDKRFPISIFQPETLMKWLLRRLNKKSFDEVKEHFIKAKFIELD